MAHLTPEGLAQQLRLMQQWIVVYLGLAYDQLPVVSFTREALRLEGAARDKALRKLDLLEQTLLTPVPNSRPMETTRSPWTRPLLSRSPPSQRHLELSPQPPSAAFPHISDPTD